MRSFFLTAVLCCMCYANQAQQSRFFFRKLTVADGLNDAGILAAAQDSRGFMWFSTRAGLNRFDGFSVKQYSHVAGDSNSLPTDISRCMSADSNGRFLVGIENGLLQYDEAMDQFTRIKALDNVWVTQILPVSKNTVYLATSKGLVHYNPHTGQARFFQQEPDSNFSIPIHHLLATGTGLLIASRNGLYAYEAATDKIKKLPLPLPAGTSIHSVAIDHNKNYWLITDNDDQLYKLSPDLTKARSYGHAFESGNRTISNLTAILVDEKGRTWLTSQLDGLLLYDAAKDNFEKFLHDPLKSWTASANLHSSIVQDRDGWLWLGSNNGVNYFNPDKNLFQVIPVFNKDQDIRNRRVARLAIADKAGKLWLGSIDGVVRFDPETQGYEEWNNREGGSTKLHYNSIRGLLCDEDNNIWIATGKGINKYLQQQKKMLFFTAKDSIPTYFYFSADKDNKGNIWFSCRDGDGFYYYGFNDKKFHSIRSYPGLSAFAGAGGRKLFHDSRNRYWLGFNGSGVGMYDPASGKTYRWKAATNGEQGIAGNFIVDITEDKKGIIWISTFTGLSSINPAGFRIQNFNHTNGLVNSSVSAVLADDQNRLWFGTGAGLMMLDSSRRYFTSFGLQDGLPSIEFPEHAASRLPGGDMVMGTQNGFVRFNPGKYSSEKKQLLAFFTGFQLPGKETQRISSDSITLRHDENFFSIHFAAINFDNAKATWFAYKLDGVDGDWNYTQNRFVNYTKLPGGNYTFQVKASADREQWNGPAAMLHIDIATIFYETNWFRLLMLFLLSSILYLLYRYRIRQKETLLQLESKTQLLEKEKALVMYESLKQQLNPHFLFNSLTSLSGLIQSDQKMAGNFLEQMSRIYRYILKNRDSELVSVKEELAFVQVYINLQKTRFKEGLQVHMEVEEEALYRKIAPVTLQNLIENAMKHNIIDADAALQITIKNDEAYLWVTNNLQRKNRVETSNKQGLESLRSLYQYLSDQPVIIKETAEQFRVGIPLV